MFNLGFSQVSVKLKVIIDLLSSNVPSQDHVKSQVIQVPSQDLGCLEYFEQVSKYPSQVQVRSKVKGNL